MNTNILKHDILTAAFACAMTLTACTAYGGATASQPSAAPSKEIQTAVKPLTDNIKTDILGQWTVTKVGDTPLIDEENAPQIIFGANAHFYANNGCNVLNGYYLAEDGKVTFANVLSTMKMCPDAKFENQFNAVVSDGRTVNGLLKKIGNETYLYLNDNRGKALMTLVRHSMQFLNGQWRIATVYGQPVDDEEANVFFDIAELKIHGNTGCNFFNGNIQIDPTVANALDLSNMGVTRRACPKAAQERGILLALEETASCVADGKDRAILIDASGKPVMVIERQTN